MYLCRSLSWVGVLFSGLIALIASMPSCRVMRDDFSFCSLNEGLNAGAEGFAISRCCEELLIWRIGEELFSILTEISPFDRCLILIAPLIRIAIVTNVTPAPMSGHLNLSIRVDPSDLMVVLC